ncbi:hypothetical protein C8Q75DRAFT_806537 [Abortiporus biennis]|nr:hypothetical protein C8Q75DRAFT_806537 [Abortiporus biennis]
MPSYLITGTGKGIGLGLVNELLKNPENQVLATTRNPSNSEGLQELAKQYPDPNRLIILKLDISSYENIDEIGKQVEQILPNGLDYLINNAGLSQQSLVSFDDIDVDIALDELRLNTLSIIRVLRAFKPVLARGKDKKVLTITSRLGSIEGAPEVASLARIYSISKAALNMTMRKWIADNYASTGITGVLSHPGVVATQLGAKVEEWAKLVGTTVAVISVEESAQGLLKNILGDPSKFSSKVQYFDYDGSSIAW